MERSQIIKELDTYLIWLKAHERDDYTLDTEREAMRAAVELLRGESEEHAKLEQIRELLDAEESDLRYWGAPVYPEQAYRSLLLKVRGILIHKAVR